MNTISDSYCQLNQELHRSNPYYGISGSKYVPEVLRLSNELNSKSVLDYGCGKGTLQRGLPFPIQEYDPAIPHKNQPPSPADLVVVTDVLEHIEPELLTPVLQDIRRCMRQKGYFVIHTGPARKVLPDGRNCHLIQESGLWWIGKIAEYFTISSYRTYGPNLVFEVV